MLTKSSVKGAYAGVRTGFISRGAAYKAII